MGLSLTRVRLQSEATTTGLDVARQGWLTKLNLGFQEVGDRLAGTPGAYAAKRETEQARAAAQIVAREQEVASRRAFDEQRTRLLAGAWRKLGVRPGDIPAWEKAGFSPSIAQPYVEAGRSPSEALADWRRVQARRGRAQLGADPSIGRVPCIRCHGTGRYWKESYGDNSGVCWACWGSGKVEAEFPYMTPGDPGAGTRLQ